MGKEVRIAMVDVFGKLGARVPIEPGVGARSFPIEYVFRVPEDSKGGRVVGVDVDVTDGDSGTRFELTELSTQDGDGLDLRAGKGLLHAPVEARGLVTLLAAPRIKSGEWVVMRGIVRQDSTNKLAIDARVTAEIVLDVS